MYYGSDSNTGEAFYNSSTARAPLDFYIGELGFGTSSNQSACGGEAAFNTQAAETVAQKGNPVPVWGYWFLMGPKADPNYNGTTTQAYDWGVAQGKAAAKSWESNLNVYGYTIFADVETYVPSGCTAPTNMGWLTAQTSTDYSLNQEVWKGYCVGVSAVSTEFIAGVYCSPGNWSTLMNNMSLTNVPIWTSESDIVSNSCPTSMSGAEGFGGGVLYFWQFSSLVDGDYDVAINYPG
ncbi:hypothetical protein [Sulfoacidibacillus ferrooxidans]|uniref:Uncharacterized protein n=1 Tax=Sulfoacidibacillus ferrooxidans TaxID=2005001 RepID=A0A9X1VES3_9BACL|nr:hypothetical protein [Sulfoacidibacillus ferrooxidans]MCI0184783.1 hypothetical protein [Sulfoacidibacillus ferrooxidans]